MPSRPRTSRARFAEFLKKFRSGYYSGVHHDDEQQEHDGDSNGKKLDPERKQKRRGYLRQYIRELWPHWKMVAFLLTLAF